jgi:hypothetical protein
MDGCTRPEAGRIPLRFTAFVIGTIIFLNITVFAQLYAHPTVPIDRNASLPCMPDAVPVASGRAREQP